MPVTARGALTRWECSTGFDVGRASSPDRPASDLTYMRTWVAQRSGVEGFVEPKTTVTDLTVVLVAGDGEWTRRKVGNERDARRLSGSCRSRCTTCRRSATRSGCATTTRADVSERRRAQREELEG